MGGNIILRRRACQGTFVLTNIQRKVVGMATQYFVKRNFADTFRYLKAVIVPITRGFSAALLGADRQYSFLDVPEAQFLSRRTYFNTTRAVRAMNRGAAIAFY